MSKIINVIGLVFLLSVFTGCMKLDVVVYIEPDGSVTVKESMSFSKRVLDYKDASGNSLVQKYLERASADSRAKKFNPNGVVKSHKVEQVYGGDMLVSTEYTIPELNGMKIFTPYLAYENYPEIKDATIVVKPLYKSGNYAGNAGELAIEINTPKGGVSAKRIGANDPPAVPLDPSVLQPIRDLQPMFSDLLTGFRIKFRFESYSSMHTGFGYRGRGTNPKFVDILSFSGDDYDRVGGKILENDEIMQEILRFKFGEINLVRTVHDFPNNLTVPVLLDYGSAYLGHKPHRQSYFRPSKFYFDKYFAGKDLDFNRWNSPPDYKPVRATFERIGAKEEPEAKPAANPAPKPVEETKPPAEEPAK